MSFAGIHTEATSSGPREMLILKIKNKKLTKMALL